MTVDPRRAKMTADFMNNEIATRMNKAKLPWKYCPVSPAAIYDIISMRLDETISHNGAVEVLDIMWDEAMHRLAFYLKEYTDEQKPS